MYDQYPVVRAAMGAGVNGFVLKRAAGPVVTGAKDEIYPCA
jgi:hypothetical protein